MHRRWTVVAGSAAVAAFCTPAFALDDALDNARILSDPLYLPMQGQLFGATSYDWGSTGEDSFDAAGARTAHSQITSNAADQTLMYGLSDDLTLRFNWGYDWRSISRHEQPSGGIFRSSSGWTDPSFGVTWRAIDQAQGNAFDLDLRGDWSPDFFPAKTPATEDEGTIARGGRSADLGLTFGRETRAFTLAGTFDALWYDTRTVLDQGTGFSNTTSPVWNYRLGLESQFRFDAPFSLNAGVGHTFNNDNTVFNGTTGLFHATRGGGYSDVRAAVNYDFVPNTVVGSIGYQHNFYGDARNLFADPANNTLVRNKDEDLVGVTLRYTMW